MRTVTSRIASGTPWSTPNVVDRYGALSFGESTFLVDEIAVCDSSPCTGTSLCPDETGSLTLPIWVDYKDPFKTRLRRFSVVKRVFTESDYVRVGPED